MRLGWVLVMLAAVSCDSAEDCGCEAGEICDQGVCLALCNGDGDCPIALACDRGRCIRLHTECEADNVCTEKRICRTADQAFCRGGKCQYPAATPGTVCPLDGEDNGDLNQHASETWTGVCGRAGACHACNNPGDDCQLVFIVQPTDTMVGELIDPAVEVQVRDLAGTILDLGAAEIQIELASAGSITGDVATELSSGTAGFARLRVDSAGQYQLRATHNGVAGTSDLFTVQSTCSPDLDNHWPLTEDGTVYTDVASAHNGTCIAPTCPGQNGGEGALEFDGTDDGLVVAASDVSPFNWRESESFSVELWMKTHADSCTEHNEVVVGRDDGTNSNLHWWMGCREPDLADGTPRAAFAVFQDNRATNNKRIYLGGDTVADQQWHHMVAVRDGQQKRFRLHLDGELVAVDRDELGSLSSDADAPLGFGWMDRSAGYYYSGFTSGVALYGRALLDSEILSHYALGHSANYCDHVLPRCGDGFVDTGEECDDGNLDGGDGCTARCTRELAGCPSGMTSYWRLAGGGTHRFDDFRGTSHASCSNFYSTETERVKACPVPTTQNGQLFDGDSAGLTIRDATAFDWAVDQSFSIEFWMKGVLGQTCMPGTMNEVIVGRQEPGAPPPTQLHWWVGCSEPSGAAAFRLRDTGGQGDIVTGATINDGSWHHVAAIHDAAENEITIFVDAQQGETGAPSFGAGFDSTTAALNIGWLETTSLFFYHGFLESVAIYSRVLTADEISGHYNAGRAASYCFEE